MLPMSFALRWRHCLPATNWHRGPESFDLPEVLSSNLEEIHRLTGIVNDMLFLSQADRGVVARRTFTPSLPPLSSGLWNTTKPPCPKPGWNLGSQETSPEALMSHCSSGRCRIRIGNATQHAQKDTCVRVDITVIATDRVHVAVTNTGQTIPPDILERIFDRFFRASIPTVA